MSPDNKSKPMSLKVGYSHTQREYAHATVYGIA